MDHADHVRLIRGGVVPGTWAELGSGDGAFTLALADLLGEHGSIVSVERDGAALRHQARALRERFPAVPVVQLMRDFLEPVRELPPLDGLLMANALHFVQDAPALVARLVEAHLRPGGRFLLVEYDADRGNRWVPYPISFRAWARIAPAGGLTRPTLLHRVPSRFLGAIYGAVAMRPGLAG